MHGHLLTHAPPSAYTNAGTPLFSFEHLKLASHTSRYRISSPYGSSQHITELCNVVVRELAQASFRTSPSFKRNKPLHGAKCAKPFFQMRNKVYERVRAHPGAVTLKPLALTTSTMMFSKNSVSAVRTATFRRFCGSAGSQHGLLERKLRFTIVRRRAAAVTITAAACSATSGAAALQWHQAYEPENCESQREREE